MMDSKLKFNADAGAIARKEETQEGAYALSRDWNGIASGGN
ncbi:hypothetical protein [Teredinibacter turnerae]|nr:hypothetical protein [Teredinibacter turnerae]